MGDISDLHSPEPPTVAEQELFNLRAAMEAINTLRSEVIATQSAGWSETIYPLVAILDAAGYKQFDPTEQQLNEYKDCHGGAGGYPGHVKREAPQAYRNPVSLMQHMINCMKRFLADPSERNREVMENVISNAEKK